MGTADNELDGDATEIVAEDELGVVQQMNLGYEATEF